MKLNINNREFDVDVNPDMPLLWVLRDILGLTGTKYGCGIGFCKSCAVLVDGIAEQSCLIPVRFIGSKKITTIEGLSEDGKHPLQKAWIEVGVSQCGYCQPGQIMTAAALLRKKPKPTIDEINEEMSGNICRCGTYNKIRDAIILASKE